MKKIGFALLAAAGFAAAANAQTYVIETRWVATTTTVGAQGALGDQVAAGAVTEVTVDEPYRQRYTLQARIVEADGQVGNAGVAYLSGDITTGSFDSIANHVDNLNTSAIDAPNAYEGAGRQNGFQFNNDTAAYSPDELVSEIDGFTASQNAFPSRTWTYDVDNDVANPKPAAPTNRGAGETWANVYSIVIEVTAEQLAVGGSFEVTYTPADVEAGGGIARWVQTPETVSEPTAFNTTVEYNYSAEAMVGEAIVQSASFTVNVAPAPASAALLGLGGLVAARRRRA